VLGSTPETTIELKLRIIRNTAVSELACSLKRHNRVGFNTLPHLSGTEYADLDHLRLKGRQTCSDRSDQQAQLALQQIGGSSVEFD